jgi:hypothetical protein
VPVGLTHLEWLNENSQRAYPLTEDATKQDTTEAFELPDDFILGIQFPVHAGLDVESGKFFLRKLSIFGVGFNISIAYDDGSANPPIVASTVISKSTHVEYDYYALPGKNDFSDSVGTIIIGKLSTINSLPPGQYTFDYEDGKLEVDAIIPHVRDVRSITVVNGSERSERLYGDIEINAGSNIQITAVVTANQPSEIHISAIDGAGLDENCVCDDAIDAPPIRTINGVSATTAGDFTLVGDDCIEIQSGSNSLLFADKCSSPCCGCEELEALTAEMEIFGTQAATVTGFINRLQSEVTQFHQTVLGSLLADDGCLTCDVEV